MTGRPVDGPLLWNVAGLLGDEPGVDVGMSTVPGAYLSRVAALISLHESRRLA